MGPPVYSTLAINLARSFARWNRFADISFHIISDRPIDLPDDLKEVNIDIVEAGRYGTGFSPKLWLDELAPTPRTLFIDSDCLCFGPLMPVFSKFAGNPVAVIGQSLTQGEFFGEILSLRSKLGLASVPTFVGAVYYLEVGEISRSVYEGARQLESRYDELGLRRLRGVPNEEPLMALSMAGHGIAPVPDDGSIKADAMHYTRISGMNILQGHARAESPMPGKLVPPTASPVIFHFNSHFTQGRYYWRECFRLEKVQRFGWNPRLATFLAYLRFDWPMRARDLIKDLLRPLFRRVFGNRSVRDDGR
jgi:hypothetical protein